MINNDLSKKKITTFSGKVFSSELPYIYTTLAKKKIVAAEIFMRLIRSAIRWYHATLTSISATRTRDAQIPRVASMLNWSSISHDNAPLAMHYLSDIRPEPARGLISFWYQTWGLISFWYQTCDGSGFEFVRTNYVQHQTALQLFSTMGEASHLCQFTLVVGRFD